MSVLRCDGFMGTLVDTMGMADGAGVTVESKTVGEDGPDRAKCCYYMTKIGGMLFFKSTLVIWVCTPSTFYII